MNDFELLYYYRMNDEYAIQSLIESNEKLIWRVIHSFDLRLYESDIDDYYQIGLNELFLVANRYCEIVGASFKTYLYRCLRTRLLNYIMSENNKSLYQIKSAYALDGVVKEESGNYAIEFFETKADSTSITALKLDVLKKEKNLFAKLKPFEQKIWRLKLMGFSYAEISVQVGTSVKKIDNTITKIQKQIKSNNLN